MKTEKSPTADLFPVTAPHPDYLVKIDSIGPTALDKSFSDVNADINNEYHVSVGELASFLIFQTVQYEN